MLSIITFVNDVFSDQSATHFLPVYIPNQYCNVLCLQVLESPLILAKQ